MILLGDIRSEIAKEIQRSILKTVDRYKKKKSYFMLVWAGIDIESGVIRTKIILFNKKPPKMLGTLLYFVDNRIGKIERIWALPLDIPIYEPSEEVIEEVLRSSKNMPILKS